MLLLSSTSTAPTSTSHNLRTQEGAISQLREPRPRRSPPYRSRPTCRGFPACSMPRPSAPKPAPDPDSTSQAHTTYKRKDSTSQSSAGSMATVASGTPLPPLNLPGQARPSREEWGAAWSDAGAGLRGPSASPRTCGTLR